MTYLKETRLFLHCLFFKNCFFFLFLSFFVLVNITKVNTPHKYDAGRRWKGKGEGGGGGADAVIAKVVKWERL